MRPTCCGPDPYTQTRLDFAVRHASLIRHDRVRCAAANFAAALLLLSAVLLPTTSLGAQTTAPEPVEVPLDWPLIPPEVGAGDTFRLLFVTSTETPINSDSIHHYNAFVQGLAAAGHEAIRAYDSHFRVLASTAAVAARDNTRTNPGRDGSGEPIYWLGGGERVADDYEDLYDKSWDSESWTTEAGGPGSDEALGILNGSTWDGRSKPKWPFRNITTQGDRVGGGKLNSGGMPMYSVDRAAGANGTISSRVYALSFVFQVAPDTLGPGGLYVADAMAVEGYTASFVVTMDGALPDAATVDYQTSDGTAIAGFDYTAVSGTLTFAAGETSKTVTVTIPDDDDHEDVEEFRLTLSNPSSNARVLDAIGAGKIDGAELTAEFHVMPTSHDGTEFGFMLSFSEEPDSLFSYQVLKGYGTRAGALAVTNGRVDKAYRFGSNHRNLVWRIVVIPTSDAADVAITLLATTDCEADLAICTDNGRPLSVPVLATVPAQLSRLSVADASAEEGAIATMDFAVTLSRVTADTVTVDYATSDGTATAGEDYAATSGTLTFAPGDTTMTISVPLLDDSVEDDGETFALTLSNASGASLGDATATGTIRDVESTPLTATFEDMPATHDGSRIRFGLTFSEELDISHVTLRDKAFDVTGGEVFGAQRKQSGSNRRWTISVDPDSATATVAITLPETTDCDADGAICTDDDRPLSHSLSATVEGEASPPSVSVTDASATEGDAVEFTVSLSEASGQQVTVDYATSGGTAESGADYTAASGTLAFEAGQTSKTVSVTTTDDSVDEEDETFTLTLSNGSGVTLGVSEGTGTIADNDEAEVPLTATFEDMPATHDGSRIRFGLTFSEELDISHVTLRDKAFDVTGGEVFGAQRKQSGSNRRWTISVDPASADSAVTITLPETTDCDADGAICTDDDRPLSHSLSDTVESETASVPSLSVDDASATEGDAVEFTVSLSEASGQRVTVDYSTSDGTAESGADYTAASGTLTFEAGDRTKTVSVETADDTADEEDETFTLTLSNASGATLGVSEGTGTIADDDEAEVPLTATFEDMPASHDGSAFEFGLTFSEELNVSYRTLRDEAFDVTGGEVTGARRKQSNSNRRWTISVDPDSADGAVAITLPETTDCDADGAICTDDERPLSHSLSATVEGENEPEVPLTAEFEDMPATHDGSRIRFGLTFSEELDLSHVTLRDKAFDVTGGTVFGAQRKQSGSNRRWTISVDPDSAVGAVAITLPETTDCDADGAICTDDDRPLSHSLSDTVADTTSSTSGDMTNGNVDTVEDALAVADGVSADEATAALFGEGTLSEVRRAALDRLGNRNGRYDLGDVLSWIDRCRRGEVRCDGSSTNPGASAALLAGAAGARGASRRPRRSRDAGRGGGSPGGVLRRRARMAGFALVMVAAATVWSCTGDWTGPAAPERDPGFVTVELDVPAAGRAIGILLEVEGPGIETVRAPGFELYESGAPGRHQIILAGALQTGPVAQFHVPDRNRIGLYRIRVVQVAHEDYGLVDPEGYRAVIRNN